MLKDVIKTVSVASEGSNEHPLVQVNFNHSEDNFFKVKDSLKDGMNLVITTVYKDIVVQSISYQDATFYADSADFIRIDEYSDRENDSDDLSSEQNHEIEQLKADMQRSTKNYDSVTEELEKLKTENVSLKEDKELLQIEVDDLTKLLNEAQAEPKSEAIEVTEDGQVVEEPVVVEEEEKPKSEPEQEPTPAPVNRLAALSEAEK